MYIVGSKKQLKARKETERRRRRKVWWKARDGDCVEEFSSPFATIAETRWLKDKIRSACSLTRISYEASKKAEFTYSLKIRGESLIRYE